MLKTFKQLLLPFLILIGLIVTGSFAVAADDEEALTDKAASQLIDSMPDFFKDVVALQKMTPNEKVNYILTQSEDRIKEKVADKFKEDMEKSLTAYAKDAFRAKAFTDLAVPRIRNAYAMGESFDWEKIDGEINSTVDTKVNAFGKAISAAKIGWGAYEAYGEGGSIEAFKSISSEVYGALAEAYIPGWGAFKLGVEMVQVLGQYVLDYATDTALEGMLNDMFGMKSNPQGLAQWLIDKSPAEINKDIVSKWDDGMGFGRLWEGQGTDKGDEAMQGRIRDTLISLRGEILARKKTEEQKQAALTSKINEYLQKARESETKTKAVAKKARDEAKVALDKISQFRLKITGVAKEVAAIKIDKAEKAYEDEAKGGTGAIAYQPIDRSSVISAYDTALSEIHDSGQGGYDQAAYDAAMENYKEKRKSVLEAGQKAVNDGVAQANKTLDSIRATYDPQMAAASAQLYDCHVKYGIDKCQGAANSLNSLNEAYGNACRPYYPAAWGELQRQFNADVAILAAEEIPVRIEAQERYIKRYQTLYQDLMALYKRLQEAGIKYQTDTLALRSEIADKLHQPYIWRASEASIPDYAAAGETIYTPGDVAKQLDGLKKIRSDLLEDGVTAAALHVKEKELFKTYRTEAESIAARFKEIVPARLYQEEIPTKEIWSVGKRLLIKRFTTDQVSLGQGMADITSNLGMNIPQMGDQSFDEYEKEIKLSPTEFLAMNIQKLTARISFLEGIESADQMMLTLIILSNRVGSVPVLMESIARDIEQEKTYLADAFNTRYGMSGQFMHSDLTPGLKYLKAMKAAWQEHQLVIEKMGRLSKAAGYQVHYSFALQEQLYPVVEKWLLTPDKIKLAEAEYEKSKKLTSDRLGLADKYLAEWRAKYVEIDKGATFIGYRAKEIQKILDFANNQVSLLKSWNWAPHKDITDRLNNALAFQKELQERIKQVEEEDKLAQEASLRRAAEYQQQYEAEQKKKAEEAAKAEETRKAEEKTKRAEEEVRQSSRINYIKEFYYQFKQAYEERNDSQLMSYMGDDWEAGDGTTLSDLQVNFSRTFRTFDEIRYNIQNLRIEPKPDGKFLSYYDVTITSRIYRRNLKHEEKSSVTEELTVDASGKPKISRTLNGRFWYVE